MIDFGSELKEFNRLYREMDELYHTLAVNRGLSDSAYIILYSICEFGEGCLQKDICEWAWLSKQTIHSAIRKLSQDGYLFLKEGKGKDRHIFLTEKGKALVEEKIYPVIEMENSAFAGMTERERKELLRLMKQYLEKMKQSAGNDG